MKVALFLAFGAAAARRALVRAGFEPNPTRR